MNVPGTPVAQVDGGSFRDREGRVYVQGQRIFRGLSDSALTHFRALCKTRFYHAFSGAGEIIASREVDPSDAPRVSGNWAAFLEHQRVPYISYPYEWTFSMLRDAALLQLRLLEAALNEGWIMKDASPYNVQFVRGKPVFIDLPSFEPWSAGSPWNGYRQFCELNLFPLMLQAYKGLQFQPFLRARTGGVEVQAAAKLFGWRDRLRPGVFTHVWLQALLDRKYGGTDRNLRGELGSAGFNREMVLHNVRKLQKLLSRLRWAAAESEWADYEEFHNYAAQDLQLKMAFVEKAARAATARIAWDLGCNTGRFSRVLARHCELVLAMDADHLAVERLYHDAEAMQSGRILPLVQNVTDPSPSWGWAHRERAALEVRGQPGLVLCLALIHHVVIGANIPLESFIDWLATLGGELVIEFVGRDDDMVCKLLRNRLDPCTDYALPEFEHSISRHFTVVERLQLSGGVRHLYYCRPKDVAA